MDRGDTIRFYAEDNVHFLCGYMLKDVGVFQIYDNRILGDKIEFFLDIKPDVKVTSGIPTIYYLEGFDVNKVIPSRNVLTEKTIREVHSYNPDKDTQYNAKYLRWG